MNDLIKKIELALKEKEILVAKRNEEYQTRKELALESYMDYLSETNGDIRPTVSTAGLHAPIDGYVGNNGEVYLKGQFIQELFSEENQSNNEARARIVCQVGLTDKLNEIWSNLTDNSGHISNGKSWKKLDNDFCYYYITGNVTYVKELVDILYNFNESNKPKNLALDGEFTIQGKIVELYEFESKYGITNKMVLELENKTKVEGTHPKALENAKIGDNVEFTGIFTPAKCGTMSYFKLKGRKARVL